MWSVIEQRALNELRNAEAISAIHLFHFQISDECTGLPQLTSAQDGDGHGSERRRVSTTSV